MMSFCRKSVHSLLGLPTTTTTDHHLHLLRYDDHDHDQKLINPTSIWSISWLVSLVTATNETVTRCSPNVLESSALIAKPSPPKKDPGGIGFIDDIGGGVDGLMSCTESLGFESSDERRFDDNNDELSLTNGNDLAAGTTSLKDLRASEKWSGGRRRTAAAEVRKFPPPLSSLNWNGQPSFFLRSVRKDGRLELTEVRINRPEILRAYRGDGRLRLHLIQDDDGDSENCIQEEPEPEQEQEQEQEDDIEREEEEEERNDIVSGGGSDEWKFPVSSSAGGGGGGEGFRRCHDQVVAVAVSQHNLHHHAVWRQHCVTTG